MRTSFASRHAIAVSLAIIIAFGTFQWAAQAQLVVGLADDFQSSLAGWQSGANNGTPPSLVSGVGPAGTGDNAMQVTSTGGSGPGRALVVFNTAQWLGNYLSAGVSSIATDFKNTGPTELFMRLALRGGDSDTWFVTNLGIDLPSGSSWQNARFSLAATDVTRVAGTQSYASAFGNVLELRLLDNPALDFRGASIAGTLLVDNVTALPEPAASGMVLALGAIGTAACLHRRKSSRQHRPGLPTHSAFT